ncbi:uridine diphosphate glucose pyrophosphatase NUDT14 isoform X3 [Artibeus jamaicensis]|uniref:uridine diphosphate glucose pyrophosphatase NUDT14 isoform X3 n=1 Tax=Artibeus jamaicensis TaxID=9417 RepID=UPI00235AB5B8|nr:uridine diphosphate glucose pyrophosphatase NUDT14 isoform X3 [Artibeus jamaicensis]
MERIEGAAVGRCTASPYLQPFTLHYRQNGAQKSWDFMKTHDRLASSPGPSDGHGDPGNEGHGAPPCLCLVTVLLFNSSRRSLVLVKQFRPAVYAGEVERRFPGSLVAVDQDGPRVLPAALPGSAGVTFELCAGLVDQPGLSLEEVACKEAWEECGYRLAPADLRRVATYNALPSSQGCGCGCSCGCVLADCQPGPWSAPQGCALPAVWPFTASSLLHLQS